MLRVAVLEDDPVQLELNEGLVRGLGHSCTAYTTLAGIRAGLRERKFDILLLDRMVPDGDGLALLDEPLDIDGHRPLVLFVTVRKDEIDIIDAFSRGADDYIGKPIHPDELVACLRAHERRLGTTQSDRPIDTAPYAFQPGSRSVALHGRPIELTDDEYVLARYLFDNNGRLLSRNACVVAVWGIGVESARSRVLDELIQALQRKLALTPANGWEILSVYQLGFRLRRVATTPASGQG